MPVPKCRLCDYDLRGIDSERCPECGTPCTWFHLKFFDLSEYQRAAVVLREANVVILEFDPGRGNLSVAGLGTAPTVYEIHFAALDLDRARAALDDAGIPLRLPVVDRAEPWCPRCGEPLDAEATCPACRTAYQWVDVGDPEPAAAVRATAPRPGRFPWVLLVCAFVAVFASPAAWAFMPSGSPLRLPVTGGIWLGLYAGVKLIWRLRRRRETP
jgi:hypothetical protein